MTETINVSVQKTIGRPLVQCGLTDNPDTDLVQNEFYIEYEGHFCHRGICIAYWDKEFTAGDVVGCGVCVPAHAAEFAQLFFTRNGAIYGWCFPVKCAGEFLWMDNVQKKKYFRHAIFCAQHFHDRNPSIRIAFS